jgi:hypothetical protein
MKKNKSKENARTLADIIKYEGIKAKGFGTIPKFIMHDQDLTLESKAIYGYFCSLCGNGVETFPLRDTILRTLKLSKNGYYDHYNALKEHGYLKVSKLNPEDIKSPNVYTIVTNPEKVIDYIKFNSHDEKRIADKGIDAYGYGILPKLVMYDERLDIKAKGIYCYFASYAGAGDTAFPAKEHILYHLNIAESTYYKYLNELIKYNYVTPIQRRTDRGFGTCDYILNQMPDEALGATIQAGRIMQRAHRRLSPLIKKKDSSKSPEKPREIRKKENTSSVQADENEDSLNEDIKTEYFVNEDSAERDSADEDSANEDAIYNNRSINKFSNNSIIYQSEKKSEEMALPLEETASPSIDLIDNTTLEILSQDEVANNISLSELLDECPSKTELINFIRDTLCETLCFQPKSPDIWINKRYTPVREVFNVFSQINKKHIEYVIFSCCNNDNLAKAKNPKAYLKQALLRSTLTLDNFDSRKFKKLDSKTPEQIKADQDFFDKVERHQKRMGGLFVR